MRDKVIDTDTHFIIDGSTRFVKNEAEVKSMLVQYDHNSERFSFRVPRVVDSHDLSECNAVRVHYINIDKSKRIENGGVDDITDTLSVCPEDDDYVICSWLITDGSTQLAGSLHFVIQFAVIDGLTVKYSWNTAKYTNITRSDGIKKDEEFVTEHNDILKEWEAELKANQIKNIEQTQTSDDDDGENVWTATFGDGRTQELKVKNGSRGETGLIGSVETVKGTALHFFTGTTAEYNSLTEAQKQNLYAIITDDTTDAPPSDIIDFEFDGYIVNNVALTANTLYALTLPTNATVTLFVGNTGTANEFKSSMFYANYTTQDGKSCIGVYVTYDSNYKRLTMASVLAGGGVAPFIKSGAGRAIRIATLA